MLTFAKKNTFRWLALVVTFLAIIFSSTYSFITKSASIAEVTESHPVYLTPASYAFSIWGVIYLALILFGIVMVSPSQRKFAVYETLTAPIIFINILNSAWIIFYTHNFIGLSLLMLILSLCCAFNAFRKAYLAVRYHDYNLWLQFPFSLIAGWLSIAVVADLFIYLQYLGWSANLSEGAFAIVAIIILAFTAFMISIRTFSLVYPAAVSWGLIGISVAREHDTPQIAAIALTSAILLLLASFFAGVFRKIKSGAKIKPHLDI